MTSHTGRFRGRRNHTAGNPNKVWLADLWECEGCGVQIVSGFASQPISEHYKPDFKQMQVAFHATQLLVNDC